MTMQQLWEQTEERDHVIAELEVESGSPRTASEMPLFLRTNHQLTVLQNHLKEIVKNESFIETTKREVIRHTNFLLEFALPPKFNQMSA